MSDGGVNKSSEFNDKVVKPTKEAHWHEFRGGSQTYGNTQDNPLVEKTVRTANHVSPKALAEVSPGAPVPAKVAAQMASYLEDYLDHDHQYDDEFATVCNCNCNCNCNCGRGRL